MARKWGFSVEAERLQAAQGVHASLEYLYREARAADLAVAAPAIRAVADLVKRETALLPSDETIDARLMVRNIVVGGRRTSVRLEADMWQALCDIARRHQASVNEICTLVSQRRGGSSLTAALRAFALRYFRIAASGIDRDNAGCPPAPRPA
jgi:predicted DNA-binding ribbon-helix-helix protein